MSVSRILCFFAWCILLPQALQAQRVPLRMELYPQVQYYGDSEWDGDVMIGIGATLIRQIKEKGALKTGIQYGYASRTAGSISLANLETGFGLYSKENQGGFFGDLLIKGGLERTRIEVPLVADVLVNNFFLGFELGTGYTFTFVSGVNLGVRLGAGIGTIDIEADPLILLRGGIVFSYQLN